MGSRAGDAGIMLFAAPPAEVRGRNGAPVQFLVGFERIFVPAGENSRLTFDLSTLDLSFAGEDGTRKIPAGAWKLWAGSSVEPDHGVAVLHLSELAQIVV